MPLDRLRSGYDTLHFTLEGTHSRYQVDPPPALNDELPGDLVPPKNDGLDISPMLDRRRANGRTQEPSSVDLVAAGYPGGPPAL